MNDETRHVRFYPTQRDHRIPLPLESLAKFQNKRHTLIRVRLHGLACAPRATLSLWAFAHGEVGRVRPATGMSKINVPQFPAEPRVLYHTAAPDCKSESGGSCTIK